MSSLLNLVSPVSTVVLASGSLLDRAGNVLYNGFPRVIFMTVCVIPGVAICTGSIFSVGFGLGGENYKDRGRSWGGDMTLISSPSSIWDSVGEVGVVIFIRIKIGDRISGVKGFAMSLVEHFIASLMLDVTVRIVGRKAYFSMVISPDFLTFPDSVSFRSVSRDIMVSFTDFLI